jgi:beta-lactam-binding protein with PASTA domain
MTQADAEAAITAVDSLIVGIVSQSYSDTVAAGLVISQSPAGGTDVNIGSSVDITVSLGKPVVPDVVGMTQVAASAAITAVDNLKVGTVTQQYSNNVPSGNVMSQNPAGGTEVNIGSNVDIIVSLGKPKVPCFIIGMTQAAAIASIIPIDNLVVGTVAQEYSDTVPAGNVIRINPPCDTEVNIGSGIDITISLGRPVVPDVVGMIQAAAEAAITAVDSFVVGTVSQAYSNTVAVGLVISQSPAGGTEVNIGSSVDITVSLGKPAVPNVVGMTQADANATITGAGLAVGNIIKQYSNTVAAGRVISENPAAGTQVLPGSSVDMVVSLGKPVVPDITGMTQAAASAAITAVDNLVVGTVSQSYSDSVTAGLVISQSPAGSTAVNTGSAVDLVISLGLEPPQAKDDFNDNRRGAMWRLSVENNAGIIEDANRLNITAVNQIDLTPFCIGHWNMDDNDISTTVIDISGNNHNGTAQRNTDILHTTGKIDGALIFNGSTDYVAIGDIIGTGAYTKAAWVKLETSASTYGHNILSGKPSQAFWAPNGYGNKLSAGHNSVWNQVQDSESLTFGTWYFVALTYDAATQTLTLYKDGAIADTGATTTPQPLTELNIGRYDNTATYLKGSIDNVMLFNRALTTDEIAALYNAGAGTETVPQYTTCNSEYSANTWSIDPNENFQTKVDYHYSAAGSPAGRIGITIENNYNNYVSILAGADGNSPYFQYEQVVNGTVTSSGETSRTSNDGTMYISYNAASDELYLSYTGYGSANAWQTISGLLDGQWMSNPLGIALGGGSDGGAIDDGQAYLDNFEVASGSLLRWPVASDLNKDGYIDFLDIGVMSEHWLEVGSGITGDLNGDDTVNFIDFAEITIEQ